ncbi:enoyl-CoA hydratase/isomerase family protein [Rhizobium wenxiniae]|uniref:enoyl-CoA hydratase/isomerase family protein n=1 Tax=Rhizobium wenxiniae TaxID=1737357 RepID=UPI003C27FFB5
MDDFIVLNRSGGVGIITLNRPNVGELWSGSVAKQLFLALNTIEFDDSIRSAVLTVEGRPDLQETFRDRHLVAEHKAMVHEEWNRLYETMCRSKKPRVAAINCIAAGSAFQVALLCDIRIAHARAMMGRQGWVSGVTGVDGAIVEQDQLTTVVANGHMFSDDLVPAETCFELGLINQIVPEEDLMIEASMLAQNLAGVSTAATRLPKRLLWELSSYGFRARIELSKRLHQAAYRPSKPATVLKSFLETRTTRNI